MFSLSLLLIPSLREILYDPLTQWHCVSQVIRKATDLYESYKSITDLAKRL